MKKLMLFAGFVLLFLASCASEQDMPMVGAGFNEADILISADFTSDTEYTVVCKGYPMPGIAGPAMKESAKESARLNAIYFVKKRFRDNVDPGKYGQALKYEWKEDHMVVHYVVKKNNLKDL